MMRKVGIGRRTAAMLTLVLLLALAMPKLAAAHIQNEQNLYEDIASTEAQNAIVMLAAIGAIGGEHGAALFRPNDKLTREELAAWAAGFFGFSSEHAEDAAAVALDAGLIDSLTGVATYADVSRAYFAGAVAVSDPQRELTREEFALFLKGYLSDDPGVGLMAKAGFTKGPSGPIDSVEQRTQEGKKLTYVSIDGTGTPLADHPKVVGGAADSRKWIGEYAAESWLGAAEDGRLRLQLIVLGKPEAAETPSPQASAEPGLKGGADFESTADGASSDATTKAAEVAASENPGGAEPSGSRGTGGLWIACAGVGLLALLAWMFIPRRRRPG